MPRPGTHTERGYGPAHVAQRRAWTLRVRRGEVACAKCRLPIAPDAAWDMGHTDDRSAWTGPEHMSCNRSAGATLGNAKRATTTVLVHSRAW